MDMEINPNGSGDGYKIKTGSLFIILILIIGVVLLVEKLIFHSSNTSVTVSPAPDTSAAQLAYLFAKDDMWLPPDSSLIPQNDSGKTILYGKNLITNTSEFFGPNGSLAHITNGMSCENCHQQAGAKPFGNNFSAVAATYPKFKPRSGANETIEKKINDCFERSLNGKPIDSTSKEMKAMVAYIKWLGHDVEKGKAPKGAGLFEVPFLNRAADPDKGKQVFQLQCTKCHAGDGQGKLNTDGKSYQYPPLWGSHSYNIGASMYRLSKFAGYIKANMPYPTTYIKPTLTDEEAWDVAAYVNSMARPQKDLSADWPDISKKAFDHPFGPYTDGFSETLHKYGPFAKMPSAKKK
jgi:thiosulfate dehydrogenase